ncbi:MAG: exonuclease domain-containing protein [Candidatus Fermentibacter sp.]|nr:exonuclease domain-containing protein [Candidatus Fermentibacter sp.]
MLRRLALLDTETTGTADEDPAIEVAVVLFDVPCAAIVASWSSLIRHGDDPQNPAEPVNGIPAELLREAPPAGEVWAAARAFAASAEAFVAHGAAFDRARVPGEVWEGRPWICSMDHLDWPGQLRPGESLVSLALRHGLGVATAHRAMADCELLARLFARVAEGGADLQAMLARGLRSRARYRAVLSYERREEARAAGFRWDAARRAWWREMAVEDAGALPFPVRDLDEGEPGGLGAEEAVEVDYEELRRRGLELLEKARSR